MEALRVIKQEEAAKSAGAANQVAAAAQEAKARKPKVGKAEDSYGRPVTGVGHAVVSTLESMMPHTAVHGSQGQQCMMM